MDEELLATLEEGIREAVKLLVEKINDKTANASDIRQLHSFAKEAGIDLRFNQQRPTPLGDEVLASLADIDPDLLN